MTIYAYAMDDTGCGNYRVRWPGQELQKKGIDVRLISPGSDAGLKASLDQNRKVMGVTIPEDCTVVVMQRPTNEVLVESIPYVQREGIRVVIDIDDDLAAVSARHPGWAILHRRSDTGQSWDAVVEACKIADLVVGSTPALIERYAKHGRGVVVPNCLPDAFYEAELSEKEDVHVGWGGAILSHPDDLSVLGASLAQLGSKVKIVGPVPIAFDPSGRAFEDWVRVRRLLGVDNVEFTGPIAFDQWIPAISQLHVGMAPLEVTRFNVAKSWLKPLEYSVAKVPFVCTDIVEYRKLGAGLLASKPKDWKALLKTLLINDALREQEIERNYEIANSLRISSHVGLWEQAWLG